ncbi:hypothetical protein SNE40_008257 [Patella caerulea]|uniref:Arrestin C-terminal-like domain-containing protein n=1 Tax=Patella caerulea TaxID=87958 RepID=A0AAN8PYM6_PATCE
MKIAQFYISLERCNGVYDAGEKLTGQVIFKLNKPLDVKRIYLHCEGKAKSHWDVNKDDSNKHYKATENYINEIKILYDNGSGVAEFPAGSYVYPFMINLPKSIPSSFEGRKGYIRYLCKAYIDRNWKSEEAEHVFTVIHHLDLNNIPTAREPSIIQKEESVESCCCEEGTVFLQLKIEKSGFVPGETINFTIDCHNNSTVDIGRVSLDLLQNVTYQGYSDSLFSSGSPKYHTKTTPLGLFESGEGIESHKYTSLKRSVGLPAMPPSKLEGCSIITTEYELSLKADSGLSGSIGCNMFILIGTVPVRMPVTHGPVIRRPESTVLSPDHINPIIKHLDAPPSYEECVLGTVGSKTDQGASGASYDPTSSPSLAGASPVVTVQPSTQNAAFHLQD